MSELFTLGFWLEALDRSIKSAAQAPLVVWGIGDGLLSVLEMNWGVVGPVAAGGAIVSVLTSVASAGFATRGSASLLSVPGSTPPEQPA